MPEDERADLLRDLRAENSDRWRERKPQVEAAIIEFGETGLVTSEGHYVPGLNTVATPMRRPARGRRYVLTCSGLAAVLPSSVLRNELAEALITTRQVLDSAFPDKSEMVGERGSSKRC